MYFEFFLIAVSSLVLYGDGFSCYFVDDHKRGVNNVGIISGSSADISSGTCTIIRFENGTTRQEVDHKAIRFNSTVTRCHPGNENGSTTCHCATERCNDRWPTNAADLMHNVLRICPNDSGDKKGFCYTYGACGTISSYERVTGKECFHTLGYTSGCVHQTYTGHVCLNPGKVVTSKSSDGWQQLTGNDPNSGANDDDSTKADARKLGICIVDILICVTIIMWISG